MKRWGLVALAIVLVACSAGGPSAPLASGVPPSPVAASPIPSPVQPIVLLGTNSKVTDPMTIPPGNYRVSWNATDTDPNGFSTLFEVYIQGQQKTNIINEVLPTTTSGEALFSSGGGSFIVDVETSTATWQITFTWLSP